MATRRHGGKRLALIRRLPPVRSGSKRIRFRRSPGGWKHRRTVRSRLRIRRTSGQVSPRPLVLRTDETNPIVGSVPMTSFRQIAANRRNASKSTGPTTEEGKQRSRCNAVRHGLTAETVIGALEDAEDYKAFEAAITADYDAQSAVERELVLRLASLLWRLRRATTIETGLFEIQADHLRDLAQHHRHVGATSRQIVYSLFAQSSVEPDQESRHRPQPLQQKRRIHTKQEAVATIRQLTSRGAICGSPTCRMSRSIVSAGMKQLLGARSRIPSSHLRRWIAANHRNECAVWASGNQQEISGLWD